MHVYMHVCARVCVCVSVCCMVAAQNGLSLGTHCFHMALQNGCICFSIH